MHDLYAICFILLAVYAGILFFFGIGFLLSKQSGEQTTEEIPVSLIVCARNEEKNIAFCLNSIIHQQYDKGRMEIIFVDDNSSDRTLEMAKRILEHSGISCRVISNTAHLGKKKSVSAAIEMASNPFIITRDADTVSVSKKWLKSISDYRSQQQADFIINPVGIADNTGLLWALQAVENNILQVVSGGSAFFKMPFLCSGANLFFAKEVHKKTQGYTSHIHIASGDDVLFMEDVKKISGAKIYFLKSTDAVVFTNPEKSFRKLLEQKIRWASKFSVNKNRFNYFFSVLVFLVNAAWLFSLLHGYFKPFHNSSSFNFVLLKISVDFVVLILSAQLIRNKNLLWYYLPVSCVYPLYACIVAVCSVFMKPNWKN